MRWVVEQTNGGVCVLGVVGALCDGCWGGGGGRVVQGVDYSIIAPPSIFHLFHLLSVSTS